MTMTDGWTYLPDPTTSATSLLFARPGLPIGEQGSRGRAELLGTSFAQYERYFTACGFGTEALRTRRRIHHKLAADPERWGEISCFRCGRCDAVCPTGIGIFAVAREMVARYGGE